MVGRRGLRRLIVPSPERGEAAATRCRLRVAGEGFMH